MLVIQMTETAEHPVSMAHAWRVLSGESGISDRDATVLATREKVWYRRKFGMGVVAALDAYGLNLIDFVRRLALHLDAPQRDAKGAVRRDPETKDPIPNYPVQYRALRLYEKLLALSGLMGEIEPPRPPPARAANDGAGERAAAKAIRDELSAKGEIPDAT